MATTRLSDLITPEIYPMFDKQTTVKTTYKSAIYMSGLVEADKHISKKIAGGGEIFNMPFYNDLDDAESNTGNDDPSDEATPQKITADKDMARRQFRTQGWSSARLNKILTADDPMKAIKEATSRYWANDLDKMALAHLEGVMADNEANDGGDMLHNIATDAAGDPTDDELIDADHILDARQTRGDASETGQVMVMHSVCATRLKKLNLIKEIPNSEGKIMFETYLHDKIWVSDKVTVTQGANRKIYSTYIAAPGLFKHGTAPADMPVEVDSKPRQGKGAGVEEIWMRKNLGLHIPGIKWVENSVAEEFPSNAELAMAVNHDRVYLDRKQIPLVELRTNG